MMDGTRYSALCLFTVALFLQGTVTWQLETDSSDGLSRTGRKERVAPGFCPDGWYTYGDMCYSFGTETVHWSEAVRKCSEMGSSLISIRSQGEQDFLDVMLSELGKEAWIGLSRSRDKNDVFEWKDSSPMNYTNWLEGEPNNYRGVGENCVTMDYNRFDVGKWNDIPCGGKHAYICKKPKDPTLTRPGRDPAMCTEKIGWLKMGTLCYRNFYKTESFSSWSQAQSLCKSYGANLAYVKNPILNKLLEVNAEGLEGPFWIGIKSTNNNKYTWLGKKHPLMYSNWKTDEPKEIPDEQNCVAMDSEGKWIIRDCDERHPFICQTGPELPEAPTLGPSHKNMTCSYTSQKWHDLGGKYCYIIELNIKFKWREALCRCMEEGGSLVSLHSRNEIDVLLHYIKHHGMPLQPVSIGLVRNENGVFQWSDGSAYDYTNWNRGEPNDPNEQCAEMFTTHGRWNDAHCHNKYGYVCSTLKVPKREISISNTRKPGSKSETAKLTGEGVQQLSGGSIAVIAVTCLFVVAAVLVVAFYCFGSSLWTVCPQRSPYSGLG